MSLLVYSSRHTKSVDDSFISRNFAILPLETLTEREVDQVTEFIFKSVNIQYTNFLFTDLT